MRKHIVFLVIIFSASIVTAGDWANWRGPFFNGSTDEKNLPSEWSTTENVAWTADLPGPSAATPVVFKDRVFISSVDSDKESLEAMCFDRKNGKLVWQYEAAKGIRKDRRSNYSAPSPVTDGKVVVFFYGNGVMLGFDMDGRPMWSRDIQQEYGGFAFLWTFSSSPLIHNGKLYLQVLQRDVAVRGHGLQDKENESYLLAMEPATGKTLWRHVRPCKAVGEAREAYSTPIPAVINDKQQLVIIGGDVLTGHDPSNGEELWRWGTWNPRQISHWRLVPSPVTAGDVVLACSPKNDPVYAIKPNAKGVLDDTAIAWTSKESQDVTTDVPTPALYENDFFILSDLRNTLSRVESQTGKVKWSIPSPGDSKYEASPLVADGKVYLINHKGDAAVINAADGKVMKIIPMDDKAGREVVRSSIIAAYNQLFIRTTRKLYCIGKK